MRLRRRRRTPSLLLLRARAPIPGWAATSFNARSRSSTRASGASGRLPRHQADGTGTHASWHACIVVGRAGAALGPPGPVLDDRAADLRQSTGPAATQREGLLEEAHQAPALGLPHFFPSAAFSAGCRATGPPPATSAVGSRPRARGGASRRSPPAVLRPPALQRALADPVLAADVGDPPVRLRLLQHTDDLLLGESAPSHVGLPLGLRRTPMLPGPISGCHVTTTCAGGAVSATSTHRVPR